MASSLLSFRRRSANVGIVTIGLLWSLSAATAGAQDLRSYIGQKVVPTPDCRIMNGSQEVPLDALTVPYLIRDVVDGWLDVGPGYVEPRHLMTLEAALPYCSERIAANAKDRAAFNLRGIIRNERGDFDLAILDFTEAIRLDPTEAEASSRLRDSYKEVDTDRNGLISLAEYTQYIRMRFASGGPGGPGGNPNDPNANPWGQPGFYVPVVPEQKKVAVYRFGSLPKDLPEWFSKLDSDKDAQVGLYEWRKAGRDLSKPADSLSSATRSAGTHKLTFAGGQSPLADLAPGRRGAARRAGCHPDRRA